jgi:hypothetical protein
LRRLSTRPSQARSTLLQPAFADLPELPKRPDKASPQAENYHHKQEDFVDLKRSHTCCQATSGPTLCDIPRRPPCGYLAAAAAMAFVEAAIDLDDAGGDSRLPRLEFHVADHLWTGVFCWMDFPAPPRRREFFNIKINATMLHDRLLIFSEHITAEWRVRPP